MEPRIKPVTISIWKRMACVIALLALVFSAMPVQAQSPVQNERLRARSGQPDLRVEQFVFAGEKALRVRVANVGSAPSGLCILRLTVRKINGVAVGRTTEVKLLPLAAGKDRWVSVNAQSVLPNNVSLESTTFRLNADATEVVAEVKEDNNEVWHNL
jgi:hypothetical protein